MGVTTVMYLLPDKTDKNTKGTCSYQTRRKQDQGLWIHVPVNNPWWDPVKLQNWENLSFLSSERCSLATGHLANHITYLLGDGFVSIRFCFPLHVQ